MQNCHLAIQLYRLQCARVVQQASTSSTQSQFGRLIQRVSGVKQGLWAGEEVRGSARGSGSEGRGGRAGLSQEVRRAEQAASSRAAAVAGVQQLLAQATMIDDSSAGLLLLPGAVASAGGLQQGVSGVV
jgi:hypothetical protein